jgi:hypothetical protein
MGHGTGAGSLARVGDFRLKHAEMEKSYRTHRVGRARGVLLRKPWRESRADGVSGTIAATAPKEQNNCHGDEMLLTRLERRHALEDALEGGELRTQVVKEKQ